MTEAPADSPTLLREKVGRNFCHPVILSLGAGAAGYPVRYFSRKLAETVGRIRSLLYD